MISASDATSEQPTRTDWPTVSLAILAGVLAAFQVGKMHIALPSISHSFSLTLVGASWLLSSLSLMSVLAGTWAGSISMRIGNKRALIVALLIIAAASAAGSYAPSFAWLMVTRFVEGLGFAFIIVAAPSLIARVTSRSRIRIALSCWSAYIPGGVSLAILVTAMLLAHHTWRTVWLVNTGLLVVVSVLILLFARDKSSPSSEQHAHHPGKEFRQVITARGPLFLALIFGLYTLQHLSVMGFLPTLLGERFHLSDERIGTLTSIAMASNIVGNLAAGVLLQRGYSRGRIIGYTSLFMAVMTIGMFSIPLPLSGFYACAFAFSCVGGLVPSSVMGAAPFHSPEPSLLGATNGLLVQGSNLGIVVGPPVMSLIATHFGWKWVPLMTVTAAILAAFLAVRMRTSMQTNPNYWPVSLPPR